MRGTIDGAEVYLEGSQLPAFTSSVNSVIDPSKVKGVSSTTVKVVNTKEAARALGPEFMRVTPNTQRPLFKIGDGSQSLFRSNAIPVRKDRNAIELFCVGGNASWFEQAKRTKIHDLDMGLSEELDSALQIATWADDDSALYFPLVDFGSLEGRANTYDVPVEGLRAGLRVHKILDEAAYQFGYRIVPVGKINRIWKKLVIYDPKAKPSVSIPGPYPAYEDYYTSNPAPDGFYFIPSADGSMQVTCNQLELNFNPLDSQFDAAQFVLVVYDFTARKTVASHNLPLYYSGDANYGAALIDHVFTGVPVIGGHEYYVSIQCDDTEAPLPIVLNNDLSDIEYDRDSGAQVLRVRPGNTLPNAYALMPTGDIGAYYEGYRVNIAKAAPNWTVSKLIEVVNSVFCLAFDTDSASKVIRVRLDEEYFRQPAPGQPFRDWTDRMDHSVAPAIIEPSLPKRLVLKYENDDGDKYLTMAERRARADYGYGSFIQDNENAYANEVVVTVPVSATINGKLFGSLSVPVMRAQDGTYQEDDLDRSVRLLVADGVASGTWKLDGATQTTYPVCYFSDPSTPLPLPFGNANFNQVMDPVSNTENWSRRLLEQRSSRTLEAHLFIRDHELQDFDHGLPTLVDDGSGPAWYWVQEIQQHRFGIHQPTKCILVQIPSKEVSITKPAQPDITYPSQPFACVGAGYVSFIRDNSDSGADVQMYTTSGYWSMRTPNGTITTLPSGDYYTPPGSAPGAYCLWSSDANAVANGHVQRVTIAAGFGADNIILTGLDSEEDLTIIIIDNGTLETVDVTGLNNLVHFQAPNAGFSESSVDAVIMALYDSAQNGRPVTYGDLSGGTSAPPSAAVADEIAALTGGPGMSIADTGNGNVDGGYTQIADANGRSAYEHTVNGITQVAWTGSQWRIAGIGVILDSYDNVLEPWLATTWILVSGTASDPTITGPGYGVTVTTN